MRDYRQLRVWERAHALTLRTYAATKKYPADERFGLISQTRRSVSSIPMNIAEGSGRMTRTDYSRFIGYASASCNEAEYQLLLARDLGYLAAADFDGMSLELSELRAMLTSFQQALTNAADDG